jgi:hypothetical protein
MAIAILTNEVRLTKRFSDTIVVPIKKKEFSIMKLSRVPRDAVSAKERLSVPFSYKWLKFKTYFLGIKK